MASSGRYFQAGHGKSSETFERREGKDGVNAVVKTISIVLVLSAAVASVTYYTSTNTNGIGLFQAADSGAEMEVKISSPGYDQLKSLDYLPFDTIAEPYKTQTLSLDSLTVNGNVVDMSSGGYAVSWTMCQGSDNEFALSGQSVDFTVNFVETCDCEVKVLELSTGQEYTDDFTMAARYVRREIRSLSDDERDTFVSALKTMYTVSDEDGQALYGSKYHSAGYYAAKHLNGAGVSDCDHWHDGAAILVKHMAFTLMVEQTLQAINPSIAIPYWEYGMDPLLYDNWEDSPMFQASWFGEEPTNSQHVISDGGVWDGVEVVDGTSYGAGWSIADTGSINPFSNAYGQLRSPWNNNLNALISRTPTTYGDSQYSSMPSCSTFQSCFESDTLADINDCVNGGTHGPVHIMIGGANQDESVFSGVEFVQAPMKLLFFKILWRMGYTRCPTTCDSTETCSCAVPDEYIEKYGAYEILKAANIIYPLEDDLVGATDETYLKLLRAVESPGIVGDFYTSGAAYDPFFWPLHGAAERLVDLKRIYVSMGTSAEFDDTWGFTEYDKYSPAAYLDGVCDWSAVTDSYTDLTLPTCTMGETCYGHGEDDILEFSDFIDSDTYTNSEFLEFIHPWNEDLLYTYDSFDYDYCASVGYPFNPYATNSALPLGPSGINLVPAKDDVKAMNAARNQKLKAAGKVKAAIPIELVTGITPIAKLKEYSETVLSKRK